MLLLLLSNKSGVASGAIRGFKKLFLHYSHTHK